MPHYKFDQIAFNITEKKMPESGDEKMYIGLEHLDSGSLKVTRWGSEVELTGQKLVMKKGDILFGRRNTYLRRAAIAPHDGIFSAHGMIFRPKTDVIDPDYFPFFVSSNYFMDAAIRISVGSLSPTVNWKTLKELEFDIPTLEEQRKNAMLLKAINETKEAYQELLIQTDNLVKSQFIEMFGDPISSKKYSRKEIGDIGLVLTGTTPSMKKAEYYNSQDIPFFKPGDIPENGVKKLDDAECYVSENARKAARVFPEKSVLITCIGTIGKVGIAMKEASCNQQINVVIPGTDVDYLYLAYCISYIKEELQGGANAPIVPILNKTKFSKFEIPVPPMQEQMIFTEFVEQSDKSKFELKEAIKSCDALMKSILYTNLEEKED